MAEWSSLLLFFLVEFELVEFKFESKSKSRSKSESSLVELVWFAGLVEFCFLANLFFFWFFLLGTFLSCPMFRILSGILPFPEMLESNWS